MEGSDITTSFPESEDSPSQPTLFGETLSISSPKTTPSAPMSSKSTGRTQPTTGMSESLLPTPQASDFVGTVQEKNHSLRHLEHGTGWARMLPTPDANMGNRGQAKDKAPTRPSGHHKQTKLNDIHLLLADSPASPFPPLDEGEARRTTAISGRKCLRLYEALRPNGSLRRMFEALLTGTTDWYSNKCALTWKEKATKSGRLLFQLSPRVRRTEGTGSGLLHTPRTLMIEESPEKFRARMNGKRKNDRKNGLPNLAVQVAVLPTPQAIDGIAMLPTPKAHSKGPDYAKLERSSTGLSLETRVGLGGAGGKTGLKLQPAFVEWMMGFPKGWCDFPMEQPSAKPSGGKKP